MKSTFKTIKSNYERDKKQNAPYIIGITGIDCGGKTTLAKNLSGELKRSGINNEIFHIDDFNNKKVEKETYSAFASGNWNENDFDRYYESIINFQQATEAVEKAAAKNEIIIVFGPWKFSRTFGSGHTTSMCQKCIPKKSAIWLFRGNENSG